VFICWKRFSFDAVAVVASFSSAVWWMSRTIYSKPFLFVSWTVDWDHVSRSLENRQIFTENCYCRQPSGEQLNLKRDIRVQTGVSSQSKIVSGQQHLSSLVYCLRKKWHRVKIITFPCKWLLQCLLVVFNRLHLNTSALLLHRKQARWPNQLNSGYKSRQCRCCWWSQSSSLT
jgi:hypothetical protein